MPESWANALITALAFFLIMLLAIAVGATIEWIDGSHPFLEWLSYKIFGGDKK